VGAHGDLVSYQGDTPRGLTTSFDFEAYLVPGHFGDPPRALGVGEDPLVGIESIRGPAKGRSYLEGDAGPNVLIGGARLDGIVGGGGNDLLFGLNANDFIDGNDGDDFLDGGKPDHEGETDKLDGGAGDDTCIGAPESFVAACETTG
jgi:Ca2+-binding RTX toxin-like protein